MSLEEHHLSVNKVKELNQNGKIKLFTKYQLKSANGENKLENIEIISDDKDIKKLKQIMY